MYYSAANEHVRRLLAQALFHADHIDRNLTDTPIDGTLANSTSSTGQD